MKRHVILLAHGRWFSRGTPASSTTKTGRHDIAEILRKRHVITHKKEFSSCWFWMSVDSFLMSSFILSQLTFIWILFAIMRFCYGIGTYDGMIWINNMGLHRLIVSYPNIDESWMRTGPSMRERVPGFDSYGKDPLWTSRRHCIFIRPNDGTFPSHWGRGGGMCT